MNTPSPDPTQELLTPWLQAYDFAVAEESGESSDPVPPDLAAHVEQVKSCLRLLEAVWPRSQPRLPTRPDLGGEVTTPGNEVPSTLSGRLLNVPGFDIEREIARGGMGVVYKARQQSLDRVVAIKCLPPVFAQDPNRLARFRREARAAAKLVNKGILPVYDVLEAGGVPLLVMPYIDGSDLGRIINDRLAVQQGKPPKHPHPWAMLSDTEYLDKILPVLDKAVEALTLLHRAEVIHRDIKPSNILVDQDGHAWLSDFGLARLGKVPGLTEAGHGLGTPGYMSPEQWQGSEAVDGRTDVFSIGVTIYQALTFALPFGRERLTADTRLPSPPTKHAPHLPPGTDAVVLRALAPDLGERYQNAAELQEDWGRVRAGMPPRRKAPNYWPRVLLRRWRALASAVGLLAVIGLAMLLIAGSPLRTVEVRTEPPGADIVFVPLDPEYGEPQPDKAIRPDHGRKTPVTLKLPPGLYFVEAQVPGWGFHQVYRYIPSAKEEAGKTTDPYLDRYPQERWSDLDNGTVQLAKIQIPGGPVTQGMARLDGGTFTLGTMEPRLDPSRPPHSLTLEPYYLDTHEV
ncbi:MAG TPA: serine/threonine-protein kinase, partial [Gemmataceae bacterium]|nr:serine/threonine-protein kinase [Gemmataceae bacterium]